MAECKASPFPFLLGISLEEGKSTPPMDYTIYQQLIGSFLYLTHSQLDIYYAMNVVSRYMQQPHALHWKAAKRILQYIQGTRTYDIHYGAHSELELVALVHVINFATLFFHVSFTFVEKSRVNYAFLQFFLRTPDFRHCIHAIPSL